MGENVRNDTIEKYELSSKYGLFVIFVFKHESNTKKIYDKDIANLKECFKKLNYKIISKEIDNKRDIVLYLEKLSKIDFTKYHSLVAAILCNFGTQAIIKSGDGEKIKTDDFLTPFSSVKCPSLIGKPKVFIFQCYNYADVTIEKTYPSENDYIFFYGIIEGNLANRSETMTEGSWLIKNFVENTNSSATTEDFLTILTKTFYDISKKSLECNKKYIYRKAPCLISTLTKKFYLAKEQTSQTQNDLSQNEQENLNSELLKRNVPNGDLKTEDLDEVTETDSFDISKINENVLDETDETVGNCSLVKLLFPTILMLLLICTVVYMFVYEEELTYALIGEWSQVIRSLF